MECQRISLCRKKLFLHSRFFFLVLKQKAVQIVLKLQELCGIWLTLLWNDKCRVFQPQQLVWTSTPRVPQPAQKLRRLKNTELTSYYCFPPMFTMLVVVCSKSELPDS
uniref:Uncharacterized protein n=1 Tax=Micrurus lemniscatus lemniscatus TaxID=129467 RepID=A0A2D4J884_MICLE